jgi:hypothetical protein
VIPTHKAIYRLHRMRNLKGWNITPPVKLPMVCLTPGWTPLRTSPYYLLFSIERGEVW